MKKETSTLNKLTEEYNATKEAMNKLKDEINAKRRNLNELNSRLSELENKINAKKFEMLTSAISEKTGLSVDSFTAALENGNVLVDEEKLVSAGHTANGTNG